MSDSVRFKYKNVEEPEIDVKPKLVKYIWKYNYTPPQDLDNNPLIEDLGAPSILITPLNFKFGVNGSFKSWQSFGNWVYRLNKGRDKLTSEEIERIDNLLKNTDTNREKAEELYKYLQNNTRYINISIKLGGLQTHPAKYVCERKYGDCKALTNYMQAMLKHVGITSYYTLIEAGKRITDIDDSFPFQAFNHAILTLPLDGDTIFLECTDKNIPFGYVGTSIQGRKALLIDENNSRIIKTPSLCPDDVLTTRTIMVNTDNDEVILNENAKGYWYELYNYLDNEVSNNDVSIILRNHIFTTQSEMLEYQFVKNKNEKATIELNARFKTGNIIKTYANNMIISPFPIEIDDYEAPEKRKTGVKIDVPEYYTDTIVYNIGNKRIKELPKAISIETEYGIYKQHFDFKDGNLICRKTLLIKSGQHNLSSYKDFHSFVFAAKDYENRNINIESY